MTVLYPPMATPNSLKRSFADTEMNETVKQDAPNNYPQQVCGLALNVFLATPIQVSLLENSRTKFRPRLNASQTALRVHY